MSSALEKIVLKNIEFQKSMTPRSLEKLDRSADHEQTQQMKVRAKRKISQYANKACFFQGQLNPLAIENKKLKEQIIILNKEVLDATDLLRNLLPIQVSNERKLKIEMAGVQEIAVMIKEDWLLMTQQIEKQRQIIDKKEKIITALEHRFKETVGSYEEELARRTHLYEDRISLLENQTILLKQTIETNLIEAEKQKRELIQSYQSRILMAQKLEKQFKLFQKQMADKSRNYEKAIDRLKQDIQSNFAEFEKSKAQLKQIYDSIMTEKLEEQKEGYELMLRLKDDEKRELMVEMEEKVIEFKKKLSEKNSEISYISGINDDLKKQIGSCKDQIWSHKLKIDESNKCIKEMENSLFLSKQNMKMVEKKLESEKLDRQKRQKELCEEITKKDKQIVDVLKNLDQRVKAYEQEKQKMSKVLEEKEKSLIQAKRKLRESEEKHEEEMKKEKEKYGRLQKQYKQEKDLLQMQIDSAAKQIARKMQQISAITKNFENQIEGINKQNYQQKLEMERNHQQKISKICSENEENLKKMNLSFERKMKEVEIENNEYVRKIIKEQEMKMLEHEENLKKIKEQTDILKKGLAQQMDKNNELQSKYQLAAESLSKQKKLAAEILEQQKARMLKELKEQVEHFRKTMEQKEAEYEKMYNEMKNEMSKEINLLKKNNAVEAIEDKFNTIISQMKLEFDEEILNFKKKIEEMEALKEEQLQTERLKKEQEINELKKTFHSQLNLLSRNMELNMAKINDDLLSEKEAHEFSKMTREDKIQYLLEKIKGNKDELFEKDSQIIQLHMIIDKKNKELEKIDEIVAEKVRMKEEQMKMEAQILKKSCAKEIENKQNQCQTKIKEVQFERMKFTQTLYDEFQEIKIKHYSEMNILKERYEELELLFQERPSRAEDLSKIKELIDQRTKMHEEIREFKKRVKEANEIVRYLNLELENYKDTYDIFGPNEQYASEVREPRESPKKVSSESKKILTPQQSEEGGSRKITSEIKKILSRGEKKLATEGSQVTQFRLFPMIRNNSNTVMEQADENQDHYSVKGESSQVRVKKEADKSEELRSNAEMFMNLLSSDHRLGIEKKKKMEGYGRRGIVIRKKSQHKNNDTRVIINDRTLTLQP